MTSLVPLAMPLFQDERGKLSFGEIGAQLPFTPQRYFIVYDVVPGAGRGGHAHRRCAQFLVAINGSVAVTIDDGTARQEHVLDRPDLGLHMPAETWGEQRYLTPDARLLVLASEPYDGSEYISDYDEFLRLKAKAQ
jgi:UDP-2-acetamido-3-amino-2,3-dideoxy-glucuronate N-acetyltransferase